MEKGIFNEAKLATLEESKIDKKTVDLQKQIDTSLAQEEHKAQEDQISIKVSKPRLTKELNSLKEKVNVINVMETQLIGKCINPLKS